MATWNSPPMPHSAGTGDDSTTSNAAGVPPSTPFATRLSDTVGRAQTTSDPPDVNDCPAATELAPKPIREGAVGVAGIVNCALSSLTGSATPGQPPLNAAQASMTMKSAPGTATAPPSLQPAIGVGAPLPTFPVER